MRIVVRAGDKVLFLKPEQIEAAESVGNYVRIYAASERYLIRHTLTAMEERLAAHGFIRIQRSVIVNSDRVTELRRDFRDSYVVVLMSGMEFKLSQHYRENLVTALGEF